MSRITGLTGNKNIGLGRLFGARGGVSSSRGGGNFQTAATLPNTGAQTGLNTVWLNPSRITLADLSRASCSLLASGVSNQLQATNFGFNIPANATITGIVVTLGSYLVTGTGQVVDTPGVTLLKNGTPTGTTVSLGLTWGTSAANRNYPGASNSLWGTTWTPAEINNSNFGAQLEVTETGGVNAANAQIDFVRMTILYSTPS